MSHTLVFDNIDQYTNNVQIYDDDITEINVHYNQHIATATDTAIAASTNPTRAQLNRYYPQLSTESPQLSITVDYKDTSSKIHMEHYSTVKQMSLNDSALVCRTIEALIGHPLLPLSRQSPIASLVFMGLVPRELSLPLFDQTSDPSIIKTPGAKQRFLQQHIDFAPTGWMSALSSTRQPQQDNRSPITPIILASSSAAVQSIGKSIKLRRQDNSGRLQMVFNEVISIGSQSVKLTYNPQPLVTSSISLLQGESSQDIKLGSDGSATAAVANVAPKQAVPSWTAKVNLREARKQGFHRELFTQLSIHPTLDTKVSSAHCFLTILDNFDQGAFVDQYEVSEIQRFGGPNVHLYQLIDLEKPSYNSTQNYVATSVSFTPQAGHVEVNVSLPFHLRYQNPNTSNYRVSVVSPPIVYIKCQSDEWQRLDLATYVESLRIEVPVGQLSLQKFISDATLFVTGVGSLVVVIAIIIMSSKSASSTSKKHK
ncbi:hypothetical protein SAMD00019534_070370 [Acytostelium subglobosum LB1]|uniref:hypothetical protein n=1 Tax=Acytostelium subglobosum LB1 TaxID=1410327 RepID=UPI000644F887|nr:hypothetical protein SAMD00019534_070370 [Acytostelium subglobosum LB1]GAM23862.1 hypothetical protein SAMD00019534_070370 [Acytostelium subglobosum LB1]|eukprot:XP_012752898.1 hypothetical protein SAMD00019534_070370 [Acytostelium subglobosum LB1]